MDSVDLIRRLHVHRDWVNDKMIAVAAELSEQQLHQSFEIGQGSIWKSLTHLYAAEFVWLEALLGNEDPLTPGDAPGKLPGNQEGEGAAACLSELQARWGTLRERWNRYLAELRADDLGQLVSKRVSAGSDRGKQRRCFRSDVLLHVCTHAQYTVAQVVNMLRQSGVKRLPDPMLITLGREDPRLQELE